jgi:hypothetical protein
MTTKDSTMTNELEQLKKLSLFLDERGYLDESETVREAIKTIESQAATIAELRNAAKQDRCEIDGLRTMVDAYQRDTKPSAVGGANPYPGICPGRFQSGNKHPNVCDFMFDDGTICGYPESAHVHALQSPRPASLTSEKEILEWINKNEKYVETWGFSSDDLREFFAGKCLSPRAQQAEGVENAERLSVILSVFADAEKSYRDFYTPESEDGNEGRSFCGADTMFLVAAKSAIEQLAKLIPAATLTREAVEPVAWRWKRLAHHKWEVEHRLDSVERIAKTEMDAQGWFTEFLYSAPPTAQIPLAPVAWRHNGQTVSDGRHFREDAPPASVAHEWTPLYASVTKDSQP